MTAGQHPETQGRALLIVHMGIPQRMPEEESSHIADAVASHLTRRFQGVTVLTTGGFWLPDGQKVRVDQAEEMRSATNLTLLLTLLPEEQEEGVRAVRDAVSEATRHLGSMRPRHLHIEVLASTAHHQLLP